MTRKRKDLPELQDVEITGIAAEGKAIAKLKLKDSDDSPIVVFIPYGAPGDLVNLKIDRKKHNYAEAHITEIITPSPLRIDARCSHFGVCGGCKWQHLPYEEQLKFKRQQVVDALQRIAKVEIPEVRPTLASDDIWEYRNKMEYTFSNKRWKTWEEMRGETVAEIDNNALGFHIPGCFDKVLHIEKCFLQDSLGDKIREFLLDYIKTWNKNNDPETEEPETIFYDIKAKKGLLRNLMIRITTTGEVMVCLVFGQQNKEDKKKIESILSAISENIPEITTLCYVINEKLNDSIADQEVIIYSGPEYIQETMGDLTFRISAKSFYQTNSRQAEKLYAVAAEFAGLSANNEQTDMESKPLVYDLYTGAGTIANYVAKKASKVIGIEYVEDAIRDARINSEINGINNTEFFAGDMKNVLTYDFIKKHGRPDVIIVDPPRAGMHEDVVKVILDAEPSVIVYVSCNPATQARDLTLLDEKYRVTDVQPVDMFPHTHHVENVIRLERK